MKTSLPTDGVVPLRWFRFSSGNFHDAPLATGQHYCSMNTIGMSRIWTLISTKKQRCCASSHPTFPIAYESQRSGRLSNSMDTCSTRTDDLGRNQSHIKSEKGHSDTTGTNACPSDPDLPCHVQGGASNLHPFDATLISAVEESAMYRSLEVANSSVGSFPTRLSISLCRQHALRDAC